MQRYEYNYHYLLEAAREAGIDTAELEKLWDGEKNAYAEGYRSEQRAEIIHAVKNELPSSYAQAIHFPSSMFCCRTSSSESTPMTPEQATHDVTR